MPVPAIPLTLPKSLARDEAYGALRGWIVDGTLMPCEILRDKDIASALGVSRTPVREALRQLEDEGLVEISSNRWTRVAALNPRGALESYVIIENLEALALALAWPALTQVQCELLNHANDAMLQAARVGNVMEALAADDRFHDVLLLTSGNGELRRLINQIKRRIRRVELAYFESGRRVKRSFDEHEAIVRAIRRKALPAASSALATNWKSTAERLSELASARPLEPSVAQPKPL